MTTASASYNPVKKLALITKITAAFESVTREDGITLHEATVIDNAGSAKERAIAKAKDTDTRWQDISDEHIRQAIAPLSFLDAKGFHYYLPAYLIGYLQAIKGDELDEKADVFHGIIFHLTHPFKPPLKSPQTNGDIPERFSLLNKMQRQAIAHFLQFEAERIEHEEKQCLQNALSSGGLSPAEIEQALADYTPENNPIKQAITQYWGQFI